MNGDVKLQNWKASPDHSKETTWRLCRTLTVKIKEWVWPEGALKRHSFFIFSTKIKKKVAY